MRPVLLILVLSLATPALAQVQSRPTDPPLVTAANESWFVTGEPIAVAGDLYFPAGAQVFFNGNTMVRSGHFNGVPIYSDTTLEPFSVIFIPVSRGMMQPYEKRRSGNMAGTTASRTPSFPVRVVPTDDLGVGMAAVSPTGFPLSIGAIGAFTPEPAPVAAPAVAPVVAPAPVAGPFQATSVLALAAPEGNDGIWVEFRGARWILQGSAVPFEASTFTQIGDRAGYPVYSHAGENERVIYMPTRAGMVARYLRK